MRLSLSALLEGLIAPAPDPSRVAFLKAQPYAHRGLHNRIRIENSRAAFDAAIAVGHGIELDVQGALGGEAFVFHDVELDRLTREQGRFDARAASEIGRIELAGTGETIPRLDEVLQRIAGRVPVLIEIKSPKYRLAALCLSVRRAMEGYRGQTAVMSFDPQVCAWFRTHAPRVVRGLVISEQDTQGLPGHFRRMAAMLAARPDFLACDVRHLPSPTAASARMRGLPVLAWTVRDALTERAALAYADEAIYERKT
jgi:glycerophosphoryl diester phosphodiesterase